MGVRGTAATFLVRVLESSGGQLDITRNRSHLAWMSVQVSLNVNGAGHFALSVASFGVKAAPSLGRGATQSVSRFSWDTGVMRPKMAKDGCSLPDFEGGFYKFAPPNISRRCGVDGRQGF